MSFINQAQRHSRFHALICAYSALDLANQDLATAQKHVDEDISLVSLPRKDLLNALDVASEEVKYCRFKFANAVADSNIAYQMVAYIGQYQITSQDHITPTSKVARKILPQWAALHIGYHRPLFPTQGRMMDALRKALSLVICSVVSEYKPLKAGPQYDYSEASTIADEIFYQLKPFKG